MRSTPKKTAQQIIESGNDYLGALKGNHGKFFKALKLYFQSETHVHTVETGHSRVERRTVSLCHSIDALPNADEWAGLKSIIRVTSYRHILKGQHLFIKKPTTRYYISSLDETVAQFAQRIRDYWHVENKVHYVRDVTQGEDASRIRVQPLPNIFALARNLALNLYRNYDFDNMAQAQRRAGQGLKLLQSLFRMK
jgi:predicted transposase YbfD/YdcC